MVSNPSGYRVLLINPIIAPTREPEFYNLGIGYIAAVLRQAGHQVGVIDANSRIYTHAQIDERIRQFEPQVIGIGTLITANREVERLVGEIRQLVPAAKIVLGNTMSILPEAVLKAIPVDALVHDEGEATIVELVPALVEGAPLAKVQGISFLQDGVVHTTEPRPAIADLDTLPFPAWELFNQEAYFGYARFDGLSGRKIPIVTTRGCPYRCTFCYHAFQGFKTRGHSSERIVEELRYLKQHFGIEATGFADDLFLYSKKRVHEICDAMIKAELNLKWACAGRINACDQDVLRHMRDAGCQWIGFGIESGNQTVLNKMQKNATVEMGREAIALCKQVGIIPYCSYMIGNEGETPETATDTAAFALETATGPVTFFITTPYPGTTIWDRAKAKGLIPDDLAFIRQYEDQAETLLANLSDMSDALLVKTKLGLEFLSRKFHRRVKKLEPEYRQHHPIKWATAAVRTRGLRRDPRGTFHRGLEQILASPDPRFNADVKDIYADQRQKAEARAQRDHLAEGVSAGC